MQSLPATFMVELYKRIIMICREIAYITIDGASVDFSISAIFVDTSCYRFASVCISKLISWNASYCIELKGWSLLPNALGPFQI